MDLHGRWYLCLKALGSRSCPATQGVAPHLQNSCHVGVQDANGYITLAILGPERRVETWVTVGCPKWTETQKAKLGSADVAMVKV